MNEEHRVDRIHLRNMQLRALAHSEREPDPKHLLTVAIVFEARGELLRLEDWGNEWLRKFSSRVPARVLEALVGAYHKELKTLPLYRVKGSDPDSSQIEMSLRRREEIEGAMLLLWVEALGRNTTFPGLTELQGALRDWDALAERVVEPSFLKAIRRELPPRR